MGKSPELLTLLSPLFIIPAISLACEARKGDRVCHIQLLRRKPVSKTISYCSVPAKFKAC